MIVDKGSNKIDQKNLRSSNIDEEKVENMQINDDMVDLGEKE